MCWLNIQLVHNTEHYFGLHSLHLRTISMEFLETSSWLLHFQYILRLTSECARWRGICCVNAWTKYTVLESISIFTYHLRWSSFPVYISCLAVSWEYKQPQLFAHIAIRKQYTWLQCLILAIYLHSLHAEIRCAFVYMTRCICNFKLLHCAEVSKVVVIHFNELVSMCATCVNQKHKCIRYVMSNKYIST